jgi:hypothetical protein
MTDRHPSRRIIDRVRRHFDLPAWQAECLLRDDEIWIEDLIERERAEYYERGRLDERWTRED